MEKDINNLSSFNREQQSKIKKTQSKKDSNFEKKTIKVPILKMPFSVSETDIKLIPQTKHFLSLQGKVPRHGLSNSNLNSTFAFNKENAFGYRILFEAFKENFDNKKTSATALEENDDNEGLFLGKHHFFNLTFICFFELMKNNQF